MNKEFQVKKGTYIVNDNDTKKISTYFCFVFFFFGVFAIFKNGFLPYLDHQVGIAGIWYPFLFLCISIVVMMLVDVMFSIIYKEKKSFHYLEDIRMGCLLAFILPLYIPIWVLVLSSAVTMCYYKIMRKKNKRLFLSPVLVGWILVAGFYLLRIIPTLDYFNPSEVGLGMPLAQMNRVAGLGDYHLMVAPYGSLLDFFLGLVPGAFGVTSILLCVIAYIFLTLKHMIKWRIPIVTIATIFLMTYIIGEFNYLGIWYPVWQICAGSLVFATIFIVSASESSPTTPIGQLLYALFLGVVIVILRYFTPLTDSVMTGIIILSLFVGIFDYIGALARFNFNKSVFAFLFAWILILSFSCFLGIHYLKQGTTNTTTADIKIRS